MTPKTKNQPPNAVHGVPVKLYIHLRHCVNLIPQLTATRS